MNKKKVVDGEVLELPPRYEVEEVDLWGSPGVRVTDLYNGILFYPRKEEEGGYPRLTRLWVNGGWRKAIIVGVDDPNGRLLFRYFMPNGTSSLQEWERDPERGPYGTYRYIRTVNAKRPPKIWRSVLLENDIKG